MKKPKTCWGFLDKDRDKIGLSDNEILEASEDGWLFPAIPESEVERDYVRKAELERWKTLWKNAKKVVAGDYGNAEKWERKYRNLSKKIEMVKQDYIHKDKIREAIDGLIRREQYLPDDISENFIAKLMNLKKKLGLK